MQPQANLMRGPSHDEVAQHDGGYRGVPSYIWPVTCRMADGSTLAMDMARATP